MRKLIVVILIIAAALIILPCLVYGQTAMVLKVSVRRIPVTKLHGSVCLDQRVLFFSKGDVMGILTPTDTLQLKRVSVQVSEPGHSLILCYDELHGNHPYRVRYLEGRDGILMYITPYISEPQRENEKRAFQSVRIQPTSKPLYGLVISTLPCN